MKIHRLPRKLKKRIRKKLLVEKTSRIKDEAWLLLTPGIESLKFTGIKSLLKNV